MNKKKITAIILVATMLLLCGCNGVSYDFTFVKDMWKEETVSAKASADMVCSLVSTTGEVTMDNHLYDTEVTSLSLDDVNKYTVNIKEGGYYNFLIDFYLLHNGLRDSEVAVTINGDIALERAPLKALWCTPTEAFKTDSFGNEIVPTQFKAEKWQSDRLYKYDYLTALPYVFNFKSGENIIEIQLVSGGDTLIGKVAVVATQQLAGYSDYIAQYGDMAEGTDDILLEAERPYYKNSSSINPAYSADINVTPYDTYASKLNVLSNFSVSTQKVYYKFSIKDDGLYNITLNYLVSNANRTTFATIMLDGEIPFGELTHYPLEPNNEYALHTLGGKQKFSFYLTTGEHMLSISIDSSLMKEQLSSLNNITLQLNDIYLDLKKIAGAANDPNREWNPDTDFPGVTERLQKISTEIGVVLDYLTKVNCANVNHQGIIYLEAAGKAIEGLLKKPNKIPNNYQQLSEGSGSIVQTIANAVVNIKESPLSLDKIIATGNSDNIQIELRGGLFKFWEGTKKFFHSFTADYTAVTSEKNTVQVWVARSRQYMDLMQEMVDTSEYKSKTGFNVKFSLLTDEGKLILSNIAGIAPDMVMGISNWLPYEMGIRGLTYDITQFSDYGQVISRFSDGAMIPLIADGIGLGLPETQDFYVMYYRKDIIDKYQIPLPNTWSDVIDILPELQRYGLNFYIPLSSATSSKSIMTTAPFIYQYGGNLFSDDATKTTIDDAKSLSAIKLMTQLYTLYGLPQQVSNFFDSFRNGSLPIGVSTFDTFVKLSFAAPEIAGLWNIAMTPGVLNEATGEVERWQTGSSTSVTMMNSGNASKIDASWELLKWWTSSEVQTEFMERLTMIYGNAYIWNSANLSAFANSVSFTEKQKSVILSQWKWMREVPKVPGWYMLERELSNSWNSIVINGENTRAVIEGAVTRIDKEIERKMTEFGYMSGGKIIKPYVITTLEYVKQLKGK